jgi:hypothetical protein
MSFSKDKTAVDDDTSETYMKYEKGYGNERQDSNILGSDIVATTEEDTPLTEQEAGDAALANAPWKYKLIALVTALLFPSKVHIKMRILV